MGWDNQYSDFETWRLRWLVAEQHSPISASFVVFRSPGSLIKKAQQLGCPFGLAHQEHQAFQVTVHPETYRALVTVGREIQLAPSRLTRVLLTCAQRRNLWADILALQRQMP